MGFSGCGFNKGPRARRPGSLPPGWGALRRPASGARRAAAASCRPTRSPTAPTALTADDVTITPVYLANDEVRNNHVSGLCATCNNDNQMVEWGSWLTAVDGNDAGTRTFSSGSKGAQFSCQPYEDCAACDRAVDVQQCVQVSRPLLREERRPTAKAPRGAAGLSVRVRGAARRGSAGACGACAAPLPPADACVPRFNLAVAAWHGCRRRVHHVRAGGEGGGACRWPARARSHTGKEHPCCACKRTCACVVRAGVISASHFTPPSPTAAAQRRRQRRQSVRHAGALRARRARAAARKQPCPTARCARRRGSPTRLHPP